jgi:hypothetical protein
MSNPKEHPTNRRRNSLYTALFLAGIAFGFYLLTFFLNL